MSAVAFSDEHLADAADGLARLRAELRRPTNCTLHWRNLKGHSDRLHAAKALGRSSWATVSSVVVCKRFLKATSDLTEDRAYLYTFRLLLERLSWWAQAVDGQLHYTLAHVIRFKLERLREYEAKLRSMPDCSIDWAALDPRGGRIDQPSRVEYLQWADIAASATWQAFEPDLHGNTEPRYLQELGDRLYRRTPDSRLTSYGLKVLPWTEHTRAAYPWVAAL